MSIRRRHLTVFVFAMSLVSTALSRAQEQPSPQDNSAKPQSPRELKSARSNLGKSSTRKTGVG